MSINDSIIYMFPYAWDSENMPGKPLVNPLLKALIERDYIQAKKIIQSGATLKGIDLTTFQRCLFEFMEDYALIKFLIDNGFNGIDWSCVSEARCIDRAGYFWSLTGRAFALGNRKLLDLLFANRFEPGTIWKNGKTISLDYYAMKTNHMTLIQILLSHGYSREKLIWCIDACDREYSKSCQYVNSYPDIVWKSYGLGALEKDIPIPQKPVFKRLMFNKTKKRLTDRYNRAMRYYQKEVQAKKAYLELLPESLLNKYLKDKEPDPEVERAFLEILDEDREERLARLDRTNRSNDSYDSSTPSSSSSRNGSYKNYEEDLRETKINSFSFVDAAGNYRRWGDTFIDWKGNHVSWGGTFVDGAGNYVSWGSSFVDGGGNYRRWGDDFIDGSNNYVRVP